MIALFIIFCNNSLTRHCSLCPGQGKRQMFLYFHMFHVQKLDSSREHLEQLKLEDRVKPQSLWSWGSQDSEVPPYNFNSNLNN